MDTYHVWWDAALLAGHRAGGGADRQLPGLRLDPAAPADTLLGRGHVGDGHIDFPPITAAVAAAGYTGDIEVEIFNETVWSAPPDETAARLRATFPGSSESRQRRRAVFLTRRPHGHRRHHRALRKDAVRHRVLRGRHERRLRHGRLQRDDRRAVVGQARRRRPHPVPAGQRALDGRQPQDGSAFVTGYLPYASGAVYDYSTAAYHG